MRLAVLSIIVVLFMASCAEQIKVSYDYDSSVDFSTYKTYAFAPQVDSLPINNLNLRRVKAAMETQMAALGFTKNMNDPDIVLNANLRFDQKQEATAYNDYYGGWGYGGMYYPYGYGGGFSTTSIDITTYVVGTLFIDFIDLDKRQLVWQGRGTKTVVDNPKGAEDRINDAIYRIMSQYPPNEDPSKKK